MATEYFSNIHVTETSYVEQNSEVNGDHTVKGSQTVKEFSSMNWEDSSYATDLKSLIESLSDSKKTILVTQDDSSLSSDLTSGNYSGIDVVVLKGVTLTLTGITTIPFNLSVEDGGQVLVDADATANGILRSMGNNSGVVAFDAVDGDETLTINGSIQAGLWQVFGDGLGVAGSPNVFYIIPQWFGARGNGTEERDTLQKFFDFIDQSDNKKAFIPRTNNRYKTNKPLFIPSNIDLDSDRALISNESTTTFYESMTLCMGWFHEDDYSNQTFYTLDSNTLSAGAKEITLTTSSDVDNFEIGKPFFIVITDGSGNVDRTNQPHHQMRRVVDKDSSTGKITLDWAIDQTLDGSSGGLAATPLNATSKGYKNYICDNPSIRGLRLRSDQANVMSRDAVYQGTVKDIHIEKSVILLGGNARNYTNFSNIKGTFTSRMIETAEANFNDIYSEIHGGLDSSVTSPATSVVGAVSEGAILTNFTCRSHLTHSRIIRLINGGKIDNGKVYAGCDLFLIESLGGATQPVVNNTEFYGMGTTCSKLMGNSDVSRSIIVTNNKIFDFSFDTSVATLANNDFVSNNWLFINDSSQNGVAFNGTNARFQNNHVDITSDLIFQSGDRTQNSMAFNSTKNNRPTFDTGKILANSDNGPVYYGWADVSIPTLNNVPSGWSISKDSTGTFVINHGLGVSSTRNIILLAYPRFSAGGGRVINYLPDDSLSDGDNAKIKTYESDGSLADIDFHFVLFNFEN
jgi:hypothetical protein